MRWPQPYDDPHAEFYARALHTLVGKLTSRLVLAWRVANITLVAMALVVLTWGAIQVEDRAVPVEPRTPVLLTASVPPGGKIKVRFELTRRRVCAVDTSAMVFDGADEPHALVTEHRDAGGLIGPDHFTRAFPVPSGAAPGPARLRVVWSYVCPGNYAQVLSPIPLVFPDMTFTIARPP